MCVIGAHAPGRERTSVRTSPIEQRVYGRDEVEAACSRGPKRLADVVGRDLAQVVGRGTDALHCVPPWMRLGYRQEDHAPCSPLSTSDSSESTMTSARSESLCW
jgi:hypothetical protein